MYNVRKKVFRDVVQIQVFSSPVYMGCTVPERFSYSTGEIFPKNKKVGYNPFEDDLVAYVKLDEEESAERSLRRTRIKIMDILRSNMWTWFLTLTFNPEKVDSMNYDEVVNKLSKWLNNMRRTCPNMKYIIVPEQHKSGRFHFHGVFENIEEMNFVDSGKVDEHGRPIYNVGNYKLGFSTATKIEHLDKTCSYISKYITKDLCSVTKGKRRYWYSRNCEVPVVYDSFVEKSVQDLIDLYKDKAEYIKVSNSEFVDVTYLEIPLEGYQGMAI